MGYDSPETFKSKNAIEKQAGVLVKKELERLINVNCDCLYIETTKIDSFGRFLAKLYYWDGTKYVSINDMIYKFMVDNDLTKLVVTGEKSK